MKHPVTPVRYYIGLICHLIRRDFILRFKGSVVGFAWVIAVPFIQLAALVFVFNKVIPLNVDSYPTFVLTALLPWNWFSRSLADAGRIFLSNADLVRRPNFPPVILITVCTFTNLVFYLIVLPLLLAMLVFYGHSLGTATLLLPVFFLVQSLLIQGLGFMIATWNVFYRDVQQIVGVLLGILFWISAVFYPADSVDSKYRFVFDVNPIAVLISGYRDILFYNQLPEWGGFVFSAAFSLIVFMIGYLIYGRRIQNVIDAL